MSVFESERTGDDDRLRELLADSDSERVRERAAQALGDLGGSGGRDPEPTIEALVRAARDDDSEAVRAAAVDALDSLGEEAITQLLVAADATNPQECLSADLAEMRMAAAAVVGRSDRPGTFEALVGRLDDPDARVRARVARALGRLGDPRAVDPLARATDDGSAAVRREVAEALGAVGGPEARDPLVGLLADGSPEVRAAATRALGSLEGVETVESLVGMLDDGAGRVRQAAVYGIVDLLSSAPPDRSHELREGVVSALSATDDATVGALVEVLEETRDVRRRRNTAWLLGRVLDDASDRAIEALAAALEDDDEMVAQFAATSLATIGGERVEDALLEFVDDTADAEARARAVFTLGKVGGERSRERLDDIIDEADSEEVRRRAFAAISRLGGR